jgi:crotonobetainyl-CoA:carnitine CoA-transferase CaiB-like acyl-CoA transferase
MGSMVAHYHRELTGEGQHVDVSCQQAVILANRISTETWDLVKENSRGVGPNTFISRATPPGPVYVPVIRECKDGHVVAFILGGAQAGFVNSSRALVALANREGMALELKDFEWEKMDASTVTQEEVTQKNEMLGPFLLTKTKAELFEEAMKQEILLIPVNTARDIAESPQLRSREFWNQVEHPELDDTLVYPGWPVKWTEMPSYSVQRRAPLIGEHNREVYEEELGLSPEQLVLLKTRGVI